MEGDERRKKIIEILHRGKLPVSGTRLAGTGSQQTGDRTGYCSFARYGQKYSFHQ